MSTVKRRRGQSLHLDLSGGSAEALPSVAALFLVLFDIKAGYTIAWKRSISGLELDGSVEFKSLPSGLHQVAEDLIYFVHNEEFAGISAFINTPAKAQDRNAVMLAVGILVPIRHGRLGKGWRHAEGLQELARQVARDPSDSAPLEKFWTEHDITNNGSEEGGAFAQSPSVEKARRRSSATHSRSPTGTRKRAISTASALGPPSRSLSSHHPALSLPAFFHTFGPLIFPIYKAALLRKRVLLVGHAPVELCCNFVYDISILSGIPSAVVDLIPLDPLPTRLLALFSVGVHDIGLLSRPKDAISDGWVACTTDDILATKTGLYDTIVHVPPVHTKQAKERIWPHVKTESGAEVKATQRDLRRYQVLRQGLHALTRTKQPHSPYAIHAGSNGNSHLASSFTNNSVNSDLSALEPGLDFTDDGVNANIVEPQPWSALAYDSFMWWASAGERRTDLDEEEEADRALLTVPPATAGIENGSAHSAGVSTAGQLATPSSSSVLQIPPSPFAAAESSASLETSIIAYFHRFTEQILTVIADIVDALDHSSDTDTTEHAVVDDDDDHLDHTNTHQQAETSTLLPKATTTTSFSSPSTPPAQRSAAASSGNGPPIAAETETETATETETTAADEVEVSADEMLRMGLDVWSESDRAFVRDLVGLYWGRRCRVRGWQVDCCGVRIL